MRYQELVPVRPRAFDRLCQQIISARAIADLSVEVREAVHDLGQRSLRADLFV